MVNIPEPPKNITQLELLKYISSLVSLLQTLQDKNKAELTGITTELLEKIEQGKEELLEIIKTIELTPGEKGEQGEKGDKGEAGERGEDGKDGYTPIKGKDYFDGKNGIDGKDADEVSIVQKISEQVNRTIKELVPTIEAIEADLPKLGPAVRDSLELLQGDERLKIEAIKDLREELDKIKNTRIEVVGGGSRYAYQIYNTPAGNISSTTVQDAINELDTEKEPNLPATPTNPDIKYLNGNKEWVTVSTVATNHASLTNLAWTTSNHTGGVSKLAGFDASGVATEYTEADYLLKDGSRDMTGQLTVIDGVFATPGVNFVGASNTGIFRGSDGRIEFVIGGLTGLQIFSSQFRINDGSLASPGLSFGNETNSGLTRTSSGVFDFSINGDSVFQFTASQILTDKDFVVDTNLLFADQSAGYVGIGTATPANKFHVYHDINGDALMRIDNPNSGSSARAGLQFRNDILGTSNQFALMIAGTSYSTVSSWQNSGIMFSASGLTGGFHYAAYAGGIHFQTGGYGTSYDRLLIEDTTITANKMMKMIGGIMGRQTTISTATASIASNSVYLRVTRTSTGTCTITLTTAETVTGRLIIIKDAGTAGTNNITIDTQGTQKIDGADTLTIAVDKGYVALWCNGTGWDVLFAKLT